MPGDFNILRDLHFWQRAWGMNDHHLPIGNQKTIQKSETPLLTPGQAKNFIRNVFTGPNMVQ